MNTKLCKNSKNDFEKHSFQVVEELSSQKYCGKCEKTQRQQACNDESKNELFSIRNKLPHNNFFFK